MTFVVGNKNDLYGDEKVKKNVAEEYAKSINGVFRCVSALNSSGIIELFEFVGMSLLKNEGGELNPEEHSKKENDNNKNNNKEFTLKVEEETDEKKPKKKGCC